MLGRRGSSLGVQIVFIVAVVVAFFYAFFLYQNLQTQIQQFELTINNLVIEKQDLNRDVQLLRETQAQLKETLSKKEEECSSNQIKQREIIHELQRQESQDKKMYGDEVVKYKSQYESLKQSFDDMNSEHTKLKNEKETEQEDCEEWKENSKIRNQECQNEIALIKDEVANCNRKLLTHANETKVDKVDKKEKKKEKKDEEVEDQKFQIEQPGDSKPEYMGKKFNGISQAALQGGLLRGQKADHINQVHPPVIKDKNTNDEKGLPQGGEGGFHEDGKGGKQVEAPKGRGEAREGVESTRQENKGSKEAFKPIPPAVMSDNDNLKAVNEDGGDGGGGGAEDIGDGGEDGGGGGGDIDVEKEKNGMIGEENNDNNNIEIEKGPLGGENDDLSFNKNNNNNNNNDDNDNNNNNNDDNDGGFNNNIGHDGGGKVDDGGF